MRGRDQRRGQWQEAGAEDGRKVEGSGLRKISQKVGGVAARVKDGRGGYRGTAIAGPGGWVGGP